MKRFYAFFVFLCLVAIATPTMAASITAGGAGTFCIGANVNLSSTEIDITDRYWTGPNGFFSGAQNPQITGIAAAGAGTYTVTGSAAAGPNLVINGDFEAGNTGFTSVYTNSQTDLIPESRYAVVASPRTVHYGFATCSDHTGTGSRLQMVVNGATTAGKNIWVQTVPVETNTNYQYTYWIQSVVGSNPCRSQLYINGTAVGPVFTAPSATCSWIKFVYYWNSGSSTTAALTLVNQNTVAGGNDFALDDIVFQSVATPISSSVTIGVNPALGNNTISSAQTITAGSTPAALTGTTPTGGDGTYTYLWESSTTSASAGFGNAAGTNNTKNYSPTTLYQTTWFRRRILSCSGSSSSHTSATIAITVNAPTTAPVVAAASAVSTTGFTANWLALSPAVAPFTYTLEYGTVANLSSGTTLISNISSATLNSVISGLTPETTYYYRVKAVYTSGSGNWSSIQSVSTYCTISLTAGSNGVITSGAGAYAIGSSVSALATANSNYRFVNWTEGAVVVSTANPYTFNATTRSLVANFDLQTISVSGGNTNTSTFASCATCDASVTPTGTLTVDEARQLNDLSLEAGGKLLVNAPLTVNNLVLKASKTTSFSAKILNNVTINGTVKFIKTMDETKWYFMSFPCDIPVNNILLSNGNPVGTLDVDWFVKYYDGAQRIQNLGAATNWRNVGAGGVLHAFQGYIFGLKNAGNVDIMFPIQKDSVRNEPTRKIPVVAHGAGVTTNQAGNVIAETHKGWNLVGQPYFSQYAGSGASVNFMVINDGSVYNTFSNSDVSILDPFSAYFVQADAALQTNKISFSLNARQLASSDAIGGTTQRIQLNIATASGVDKTNFILDDNQSADYQIGQDMEKWLTTGTAKPQIYSQLNNIKYAYNALPANELTDLPLGVYTKTPVSTTISLTPLQLAEGVNVILTDVNTGVVTDLNESDYTFTSTAGLNNTRFRISVQQSLTTGLNKVVQAQLEDMIIQNINGGIRLSKCPKFNKLNLIDALGRTITNTTVNTETIVLQVPTPGVYFLKMETNGKFYSKKVVVGL